MWLKRKSIDIDIKLLVHQGCSLLSQAIINIALADGCEIFTTYKTFEEKQEIIRLFPTVLIARTLLKAIFVRNIFKS